MKCNLRGIAIISTSDNQGIGIKLTLLCGISISTIVMTLLIAGFTHAAEQKDVVIALVNGERILMSELNREMRDALESNPVLKSSENLTTLNEMRHEALDYLIDQELMVQEGIKLGFSPKDSEVQAEFTKIKQRYASEALFQQALKQQELTEEKVREIIRRGLIVRRVLAEKIKPTAKPVTDKDIDNFYAVNKTDLVEPEKVRVRHILIKFPPDANNKDKATVKKRTQAVLDEVKSGANFAELAKKYSHCSSAQNGGDLGYITSVPGSNLVKPFIDAAFSLKPGQISGLVETDYGYHIIMVEDKKPERQLELKEVVETIKEVLTEEELSIATEKWLESVRKTASINIMLKD